MLIALTYLTLTYIRSILCQHVQSSSSRMCVMKHNWSAVSLFRAKTVQQRPLLPREVETQLRIVGSHTRWELSTCADFQLCLHRLLTSTGCKSSHSGFLDVSRSNGGLRISGWIGKLSCLTIFSTSLSVAAFLRRARSAMLESTGSYGTGVERRVPDRQMDSLLRQGCQWFICRGQKLGGNARWGLMPTRWGRPLTGNRKFWSGGRLR